jgi:drug/metabolite transporter (DMT)-like permease
VIGFEIPSVVFGLGAAVSWGAGDFTGGLASKRSSVYGVIIFSQAFGAILLLTAAWWTGAAPPPVSDLGWGACAGVCAALGLLALYRGLAEGSMGVVAPVAALVTVSGPVVFGALFEGLPGLFQVAGFALALVAIGMITRTGAGPPLSRRQLRLAVVAGLFFGAFFILMDHVADRGVLWPALASRSASLTLLLTVASLSGQARRPPASQVPVALLTGLFETGGTLLFMLATSAGRLDTAATLASLYPAATALLARFVIDEQLGRLQWLGVGTALFAIALISR